MLFAAALATVSLTASGAYALPGVAPEAPAAMAAHQEGTVLYGAFIAGTVLATKRTTDGVQLTVDVAGPQPRPDVSNFHGKLVFTFINEHAGDVRVGDRVSGFVNYVTVDLATGTFINDGWMRPTALKLDVTPAGR